MELEAIRAAALEAAQAAGRLIRSRAFAPLEIRPKHQHDIVTELDLASESLIVDRIRQRFPGHQIVSEERGALAGDPDWTWIVDPLDGTNNLAIGLPAFAVGIAVCRGRVPVVAVVHEPMSGRSWSAVRGRGRDGWIPPLRYRSGRIIAWTQGYGVPAVSATASAYRLVLERACNRLIQLWAPLPCWLMLVRGDIDAFVGYRVGQNDLFAGTLLATESGLVVRHINGSPFDDRADFDRMDAENQSFVAGPAGVVGELIDQMTEVGRVSGRVADLWMPSPSAS